MKLPVALAQILARFDALSMRERALVAGASLIGMVLLWLALVFDPMSAKQRTLSAELTTLQQSIHLTTLSIQETADADPTLLAQREETRLKTQLADDQHAARDEVGRADSARAHGAGDSRRAVAPARRQRSSACTTRRSRRSCPRPQVRPRQSGGPYVHPVEIVVEGTYLDVLAYLHALESLEWRFYWRLLELESTAYPRNRVRIELSTLSLDKDWIGV